MTSQRARTLTRPASQDEQDVAENWRVKAECRDTATPYYDPHFPEGTANHIYNEARRICGACPVAKLCLDGALASEGKRPAGARFGMRGGKTPKERADIAGVAAPGIPPARQVILEARQEREAAMAARRTRVADLANAGHITKDIADTLGMSVTSVLRDFRILRAEGRVDAYAGLAYKPGANCGTPRGARQHMNARESLCKACRDAVAS